ncbi:MAG TPA: hypothetical protein VNO23_09950, partial [Candidatus Binatia bacterium]|nr:hypothetical protein [Candidatus Binatia bacterium]
MTSKAARAAVAAPLVAVAAFAVALAHAGPTADVRAVLREAARAAAAGTQGERRLTLLSRIAFLQSRAGDTAGALGTARDALAAPGAQKPDAEAMQALAILITVQARAGDRAAAMQTLKRLMNGVPADRR